MPTPEHQNHDPSALARIDKTRLASAILLASRAAAAKDEPEMTDTLAGMRDIIPFDSCYVSYYFLGDDNETHLHILNSAFDKGWCSRVTNLGLHRNNDLLDYLVIRPNRSSMLRDISPDDIDSPGNNPIVKELQTFGIEDFYVYTLPDHTSSSWSFLTLLFGPDTDFDDDSRTLADHLALHVISAAIRIHGRPTMNHPLLSVREEEVLHWLKNGKYSQEIAAILGISRRTVDFHVANIIRKLGANNRSHAIAIALSRNENRSNP